MLSKFATILCPCDFQARPPPPPPPLPLAHAEVERATMMCWSHASAALSLSLSLSLSHTHIHPTPCPHAHTPTRPRRFRCTSRRRARRSTCLRSRRASRHKGAITATRQLGRMGRMGPLRPGSRARPTRTRHGSTRLAGAAVNLRSTSRIDRAGEVGGKGRCEALAGANTSNNPGLRHVGVCSLLASASLSLPVGCSCADIWGSDIHR